MAATLRDMGDYGEATLSARAASTGRGGVRSWSGTESRRPARDAGTRGASVQQVVAERKEQSRSRSDMAEDEDVCGMRAAQPESGTGAMAVSGIGCDVVMVVSGGMAARSLQVKLPYIKEKRESQ